MSTGAMVTLDKASRLAERVVEAMRPYCDHVEVAGSVRRQRPQVSDIEVVGQPRLEVDGLLGERSPAVAIEGLKGALAKFGHFVKNGDRYIQIGEAFRTEHFDGMNVDVFLVHPPAVWSVILAIRTGPADLGKLVVTRMQRRGFRTVNGHVEVIATGKIVDTASEAHFFACAGLPCLEPHHRDLPSARIATL